MYYTFDGTNFVPNKLRTITIQSSNKYKVYIEVPDKLFEQMSTMELVEMVRAEVFKALQKRGENNGKTT